MKVVLWRGDIVLHRFTLEVADVQTDSFGGLPRRLIPVRVNTYGGVKKYAIEWRAEDCIKIGGLWSDAWLKLKRMRDFEGWPLVDPRIDPNIDLPREMPEVA